MLTTLR